MQHTRWAGVLVLAGVFLAGCSGPAIRHQAQVDPNDDFDASKVATVTQWAQARGATVVWMHYPIKRRNDNDGG
jgi:hypothetical protein